MHTTNDNQPSESIWNIFKLPLTHARTIPFVLIGIMIVTFAPQLEANDWWLNTRYLSDGLAIYQNDSFVYPPWSLGILWIYYLITATGARIASVLVVIWLVISRGWQLRHFLALVLSPFFVFSLPFSNMDILVLILPLLMWEIGRGKSWVWVIWGLAITIMLVKPQGAILIVPYLLWQDRAHWRLFIPALTLTSLLTIPITFIGSPPLILQWLDNIQTPSTENIRYWTANNISMTDHLSLGGTVIILISSFIILKIMFQWRERQWRDEHSYLTLILISLLLSPYASLQSLTGSLVFAPSPIAITIHWLLTLILASTELFLLYSPFWVVLYGVIALWFLPPNKQKMTDKTA